MRTKYERGKTLTYPTMYPKLLITPIFARRDDWKWVEEIRCRYDAGIGKEPEFSFVRDTARSETVDRLTEENQRLRELVKNMFVDQMHPRQLACAPKLVEFGIYNAEQMQLLFGIEVEQ